MTLSQLRKLYTYMQLLVHSKILMTYFEWLFPQLLYGYWKLGATVEYFWRFSTT